MTHSKFRFFVKTVKKDSDTGTNNPLSIIRFNGSEQRESKGNSLGNYCLFSLLKIGFIY